MTAYLLHSNEIEMFSSAEVYPFSLFLSIWKLWVCDRNLVNSKSKQQQQQKCKILSNIKYVK